MTECCMSPVGCVTEIGKSIITQCLWPPVKRHIDYWWCFDDNIQGLRDGVRDLDRKTFDINQEIEEARLGSKTLRPGVEDWAKAGTEKLAEARRILPDNNTPKAWNLISRYSMGKNAKKKAEEIAKLRNDGNFNTIADPAPPPSMGSPSHRQVTEFNSRKRIEEEIIESLTSSSVGLVGICGMGGVGKTTMVESIRKRVKEEKICDEVVMVVVSQKVDMLKTQEEIAELLGLKFDVKSVHARADRLCTRLMDTNRKLIILDDVWEILKFEDLGIPFESERCKVLLTSRSRGACKGVKSKKVFELKILEEDEAWILFKEKAGECVEHSALFSVAKEVVAQCNGLPIALVTVGMALQDEMNKYRWEDSLSQLRRGNPLDFPEVLTDVYKPLKLSYDYLKTESEKSLFLLCCLFPEDYQIPVEELTLYSMGLQIFNDIRSIKDARSRTHGLIEMLKSRFLLIDGENKLHVKMHDVVRDVAIYIGSKEKEGFLKIVNETSIESSSDVSCNWMSLDHLDEQRMGLCFPKLRLLMVMVTGWGSNKFSDISLEGMEDLNVLSLSWIGSIPPTLGLLKNLRTLYLFSCVVENFSVIGELPGLEILYCYECGNIKELPAEIGRLKCLRLLELIECHKLERIPFGIISSLVRLEELKIRGRFCRSFCKWETGGERGNAAVTELGSLPNLTCLEIEMADWNLASQDIRLSTNLVKYFIRIEHSWTEPEYDPKYRWIAGEVDLKYNWTAPEDCEKVMFLKLPFPHHSGAVGNWIKMLVRNTECLFLGGGCPNNINLAKIENLRYLSVENCSTLKKLVETKDCKFGIVFPLLKTLNLCGLEKLEEICHGTIILNSLCNLKSINISYCSKVRYLFSMSVARASLLQLEALEIEECKAMEQVFWNEITDDTDACIEFPKLKKLKLNNLPNLTAFCQGIENIKFPILTKMNIRDLPKLNNLCPLNSGPLDDHTTTSFHFLCNPKVEMGPLQTLRFMQLGDKIRNIWCHQIPNNVFNNLKKLYIYYMNGIRSLMSTLIAKNLVSLNLLCIGNCEEMVEVIERDDDDKQVVDINCLFPNLRLLIIERMCKLIRFWQWNHPLELPLLEDMFITSCPVIETFTLGSINTPNMWEFNSTDINYWKDLNDAVCHVNSLIDLENKFMLKYWNEGTTTTKRPRRGKKLRIKNMPVSDWSVDWELVLANRISEGSGGTK